MPLDRSVLGNLASEQMEALEEAFGEHDDAEMGAAITIVEILTPTGESDAEGNPELKSDLRLRTNVTDPYRLVGLLDQLKFNLLAM
jgi:hypothetical protein